MLSRYEIFIEVVESQSFTRTAEKLGYTQGAISQTIKSMEEEMSTRLFERRRGGVLLTEDGQRFYPYIRNIYLAERRLQEEQEALAHLENSEIRMGVFTSISRVYLPPILKKFREKYPNVKFSVRHGEYSQAREWVLNGEVDFAFINSREGKDLEMLELFDDELCAILRPDHPLAKKKVIELADLVKEPLILIDEQPSDNILLNAFEDASMTPNVDFAGYDEYSIYAMVKQGLGLSAAYRLCLTGFEEGLAIRRIKGHPSRKICVGWKTWDSMPYAARKFIDSLGKK